MQMYQSKLYENQTTRGGKRWYGGSQHFHYMTSNSSAEAYSGAKMVHSTMIEMISNVSPQQASGSSHDSLDIANDVVSVLNHCVCIRARQLVIRFFNTPHTPKHARTWLTYW